MKLKFTDIEFLKDGGKFVGLHSALVQLGFYVELDAAVRTGIGVNFRFNPTYDGAL